MAATCTVIALVRDLLVIASVVAARVRAAVTSGNAAGAQGGDAVVLAAAVSLLPEGADLAVVVIRAAHEAAAELLRRNVAPDAAAVRQSVINDRRRAHLRGHPAGVHRRRKHEAQADRSHPYATSVALPRISRGTLPSVHLPKKQDVLAAHLGTQLIGLHHLASRVLPARLWRRTEEASRRRTMRTARRVDHALAAQSGADRIAAAA